MKEFDLRQLLEKKEFLRSKISTFLEDKVLLKKEVDVAELSGHVMKADHNLHFVSKNMEFGFLDWAVAGCYYASYHAAVALILTRGYSSKNHLATLCILIKEFYGQGLSWEDISEVSLLLDYQDVLFYVESKNKREEANYSTRTAFSKPDVEKLRLKAVLFVAKIKNLLKEQLK